MRETWARWYTDKTPMNTDVAERPPGFALFALGFRPFFLGAGAAALALVGLWVVTYVGEVSIQTYYDPLNWHAHEMVFGYATAVIAGFLLTAVRNWTNIPTLRAQPLAALAALWLAARILAFVPVRSRWLIAAVDVTFLPALALSLAGPLLRSGQIHNWVFPVILGVMAAGNVLVHLQVLGFTQDTAYTGTYLAVDLIVLVIAIIAGRVIPFFTERAVPGAVPRRRTAVDRVALAAVVAFGATQPLRPSPALIGVVALVAAVAHGMRLWGWYDRRIWSAPLLWVLHLGYGWIVAGFALHALAAMRVLSPLLALHAFTAGGIGVMTLGMMARVALGHTGRPLQAPPPVAAAFALINLAALVRVLFPFALPDWYVADIGLSGALWAAAFVLFLAVYSPILIRPRVDGRPG